MAIGDIFLPEKKFVFKIKKTSYYSELNFNSLNKYIFTVNTLDGFDVRFRNGEVKCFEILVVWIHD